MLESFSAETLHGSGGDGVNAGQRVALRFATAADIRAYYETPPPQTLRAVVVTLDDRPAAIVGLAKEVDYFKLFSEYKSEFKPYLRSMATLRAIKAVMRMVERSRIPVVAVTQPNEPDSPRLLQRLGFKFHDTSEQGDIYEWHS